MKRSAGLFVVAIVLWFPSVALAHDPIFVNDRTPPGSSPLIEDGTISFAIYGTITDPDREATVRIRFAEGQTRKVELLVPDRAPENNYTDFGHLQVTIESPTQPSRRLVAGPVLERFDEPFSKTSYLRLLGDEGPADPGITTVTIRASEPTRFTLATGQVEKFGTAVSQYERVGLDVLARWYETAPPSSVGGAPSASDGPPPPVTAETSSGTVPSDQSRSPAPPVPGRADAPGLGDSDGSSAWGFAVGGALVLMAGVSTVLVKRART